MDAKTDRKADIRDDQYPAVRVKTHRSGYFTFEVGVDFERIQPLLERVNDAQVRFSGVPILPDLATRLEREVIVSSVFGTNTIEGGTLTEEETAALLAGDEEVKEEKQRRVTNIRDAYSKAEEFAQKVLDKFPPQGGSIHLVQKMFLDLHKIITDGLSHPQNVPGQYRNNQKGQLTKISDAEHGGVYIAPKSQADIELLVKEFLSWINNDELCKLSPLIRAPLVHYYFERIHPFWDGNGRVGRVLEAIVLKCSSFKYAPFALSRYYLENIDAYFTIFNTARKAAEGKELYPNTEFVEFFLKGLLNAINRLHDRVNSLVGYLLYDSILSSLLQQKKIGTRQFTLINNLLPLGAEHDLKKVQAQTWYKGLYEKLTVRTQYRDIKKLIDHGVVKLLPGRKLKLLIPGK